MGRDLLQVALWIWCGSFNPRARMGRDDRVLRQAQRYIVSIHAPAWGATIARVKTNLYCRVSIHAPAWGATKSCDAVVIHVVFQSTRPHGARHGGPRSG